MLQRIKLFDFDLATTIEEVQPGNYRVEIDIQGHKNVIYTTSLSHAVKELVLSWVAEYEGSDDPTFSASTGIEY